MAALVVFESMFGNTRRIADSVTEGLSEQLPVELVEVGAAPAAIGDDVELLVVGGPTHAFGLSRSGTRQSAAQQAEDGLVSTGIGLREWLGTLTKGSSDVAVAAFDTRISKPRLPGSAAAAAEKRLRRLGFRVLARSQSFFVEGTTGPLLRGERERARRWGESLPLGWRLPGHHLGGSPEQPDARGPPGRLRAAQPHPDGGAGGRGRGRRRASS
jgi:hypothetical protein